MEEEYRKITLISDTGQSIIIAEDADDYVLDQDGLDLGSVNSTHNMTQYIDLIGKHLDSTVLSPRDISIVGWIIGDTFEKIKQHKIKLNKLVNPLYWVKLEYGKFALDFLPDSSIKYSTEWESNNSYMCKFQIQGTAPMPLFRLKDYNTFRETVEKMSQFHFPVVIPKKTGVKFGFYPWENIKNMPNDGDVESGMVIVLTAKDSDVKNPRIVNETTGTEIAFNYTLLKGEILNINTVLGQQTVTLIKNGVSTNAIKYLTIESDIDMTLALGINRLMPYAEEGIDGLNVHVEFSPRFLEVEGR